LKTSAKHGAEFADGFWLMLISQKIYTLIMSFLLVCFLWTSKENEQRKMRIDIELLSHCG